MFKHMSVGEREEIALTCAMAVVILIGGVFIFGVEFILDIAGAAGILGAVYGLYRFFYWLLGK